MFSGFLSWNLFFWFNIQLFLIDDDIPKQVRHKYFLCYIQKINNDE